MRNLNLCSGAEYQEGWINIDIDPRWKSDILCDIEKGIPLKDNSIDNVFIKHSLEHINPKKLEFVLSEVNRICKNGSKIVIYCPYFSCSITYKTWDHVTPISYYSFDGLTNFKVTHKKLFFFRNSFGYENKTLNRLFKIINPTISYLPNKFPLIYERFFCWIFPVEEILFNLEVIK